MNNIIEAINLQLRNRLTAYSKMEFYGIVDYKYHQSSDGTTVISPIIVGFGEKIATDIKTDVHGLRAYHRLGLTTITAVPGQNYGNGETVNNRYSTDLQMLVMGTTDRLNTYPYDFASIIADSFPMSMTVNEKMKFETTLFITGIQHDKRSNFNQEFSGVNYFLGPEYFFFSIRYRVEATYLSGCTNYCEC